MREQIKCIAWWCRGIRFRMRDNEGGCETCSSGLLLCTLLRGVISAPAGHPWCRCRQMAAGMPTQQVPPAAGTAPDSPPPLELRRHWH